jgi:hypothetical protein
LKTLRSRHIEALVARDANDVAAVSRLAAICEADGDMERCQQLLAPLEDRLGDTEGARILGQIYAGQGNFEKSHALLGPYTEQRLTRLHAAEQDFENVFTAAQRRVIGQPQQGDVAEALSGDELRRLSAILKNRLAPLAATPACDRYWMLQIEGREGEAIAVLRGCADQGVPIPVDF